MKTSLKEEMLAFSAHSYAQVYSWLTMIYINPLEDGHAHNKSI